MVVVAVVLAPTAAFAASALQPPLYEASASVLLRQSRLSGDPLGAQIQASSNPPQRALQTQAEIARSPAIARRVLDAAPSEAAGSVREFLDSTTVVPDPAADILAFRVVTADGATARHLADEYATQFVSHQRRLETQPAREALADLQADSGSGARRTERELETLLAVHRASTPIVKPSGSARRVQPRPLRDASIALALGLVLGIGFALLWEAIDARIRSPREITDGLGMPLLGTVRLGPGRQDRGASNEPARSVPPDGDREEAFRDLRLRLEAGSLRDGGTMVLTGPLPARERSLLCENLAFAFARAGRQVILADCDRRSSPPPDRRRLSDQAGLAEVAPAEAQLEDALVTVLGPGHDTEGSVEVLTRAVPLREVADLDPSSTGAPLTRRLREMCDVVLINSSPVLALGSGDSLGADADALLLAIREGALTRQSLVDLRRTLDRCPAEGTGWVLIPEASRSREGPGHLGSPRSGPLGHSAGLETQHIAS